METINKMIVLAMEQYRAEFGQDAKLEEGEEFVTVFNDAVLIIGIEDKELNVKIVAGEPYKVDFDCNLVKGGANE